jgi:DNA-directed RNA polymerase subunit RPC12/RpoP
MPAIKFKDIGDRDLVDAFTGGNIKGGIYKCSKCLARYGEDSVKEINAHNDRKCIACGTDSIVKDDIKFKFEVGKSYDTLDGKTVKVTGRTISPEYECLICSDGKHRYDRSNGSEDAGRVTGTSHDFSCPDNFKKIP